MTSEFVTKIPADKLDDCQSWLLPEVTSEKVIPAVKEKSIRIPRGSLNSSKALSKNKNKPLKNETEVVESVEIIETIEDVNLQPLTAEQLQEITESSEKEGFDAGYRKGFEEAKRQGYQKGLDEAKAKVLETTERLQHITDALLIPLENEQKNLEQQLLNLVCQLTTVVVNRELQTDSSHIAELVKQSLELLPSNDSQLTLYLNSQDIEMIKEAVNDKDKHASYKIDDSLLPGGCRLETAQTSIDASVEHRLQQVLDDFLHKRHVSLNEGPKDEASDNEALSNKSTSNKAPSNDKQEHTLTADTADVNINKSAIKESNDIKDESNIKGEGDVMEEKAEIKSAAHKEKSDDDHLANESSQQESPLEKNTETVAQPSALEAESKSTTSDDQHHQALKKKLEDPSEEPPMTQDTPPENKL